MSFWYTDILNPSTGEHIVVYGEAAEMRQVERIAETDDLVLNHSGPYCIDLDSAQRGAEMAVERLNLFDIEETAFMETAEEWLRSAL